MSFPVSTLEAPSSRGFFFIFGLDLWVTLEGAITAFEEAMAEIDGFVSADSATTHELNRALREISSAGRALQDLARTLEDQPEALIRGKSGSRP